MIRCRTELDKDAMNALSRYHIANKIEYKRRKKLIYFLGIVMFVIAVYAAVTSLKDYYGTESIFYILAMPVVFVVLGVVLFITANKGMAQGLTRELKRYFEKTQIRYLDYVISESGIRISINGSASFFKWDMIDKFEEDADYYYFSSKDKYNIISKKEISQKNKAALTELADNALQK